MAVLLLVLVPLTMAVPLRTLRGKITSRAGFWRPPPMTLGLAELGSGVEPLLDLEFGLSSSAWSATFVSSSPVAPPVHKSLTVALGSISCSIAGQGGRSS